MADAVSGDGNGSLHNPPEESVIRSRSSTDASKAVTLAWGKKKILVILPYRGFLVSESSSYNSAVLVAVTSSG